MVGLRYMSRVANNSESTSGATGVDGTDGVDGADAADAADNASGAVAGSCAEALDSVADASEGSEIPRAPAVTAGLDPRAGTATPRPRRLAARWLVGSGPLSASISEPVLCWADTVEIGRRNDGRGPSSLPEPVFCWADNAEVGRRIDGRGPAPCLVWCRADAVEAARCEDDWDVAVPDAEPSDESEPVSEGSAEATPWPVATATPSPNATAPTRSHFTQDSAW